MKETGFLSALLEWFSDPAQWEGSAGIPIRVLEHVQLSAVAVLIAALVALPLAMYIGHTRRLEFLVVSIANAGRAIPSFGLLFLFYMWLGLGLRYPTAFRPSILIPLVLLAIPPILTNTYVGIQGVDEDSLEAARGMGMSEGQLLRSVELPLASPLILAGLRIAAVQVVATATLAAVIAGGGLGRFIVDGFSGGRAATARAEVFAGALLVAFLAILTELAFGLLERAVSPRTSSRGRRHLFRPGPPEEAIQKGTVGPAA